ncbi:uncharacterized protein LOC112345898 [Selaginella moellendorffii]|uniref:uncharacterized protein LOC112345898 n=1 Tax=Selaginella moellendorffii TaxID=88036 RepID=UPI000D1C292C|nr:uncharacterized protein LOC112345898 [Selaginella moellendorffii]|eukprot:XP_024529356.1 uncharacterized protein LOC112345898 [Selaginella moellendorffii]
MAILANNHRAGGARSSSDAGAAAPRRMLAVKLEDSEVSTESELSDKGMETCQVGESIASFPFELFDLPDLKNILSLETWNFYLSEEEREQLMAFMPPEIDQEAFATTLKELLSGTSNIFFGNPMAQLFESLKGGHCQPNVVQYSDGIKCLQRKEHYQLLRKYHNSMVSSFVEMQKLWEEYPDVEIEGRLEIWRKWKDTKVKPQLPKVAEKTFKAVQKAKMPETVKDALKSKAAEPVAEAVHGNTRMVAKGAVAKPGLAKAGRAASKGGVVKKSVPGKAENAASPVSDDPEAFGNDSGGGGGNTSSSLTSGEKKRKSNVERASVAKRTREDESMTSSEDSDKKASSVGKQRMQALVDVGVAKAEPGNEEAEQKKKTKKKVAAEKEVSESPPPSKVIKKLGVTFPFSIILFLSALRRALLTPAKDSGPNVDAALSKNASSGPSSPTDDNGSDDGAAKAGFFCVPFSEVVSRVQENPGDRKVLQAQEPLQDLAWGALKVLSSKIAPAGAKGWKPLTTYEKESKSWYWIGPQGSVDESGNMLADDWGVPSKILSKLEEAFATWYKHGEETRQQMVQLQLPPPPVASAAVDERERFRDMRAQKSLITIAPSSEDMRSYFRKEEILRYSVPDRAFAYTRSDGQKSVVAPLRRGGGKPNSKARDHSMLKPDRPPHVTILCLVRDAAARLPGGVGTRADVCALIRDSQFVVEDVSEAQVHQVVSGALDRLHYERDPCVRYDGERKLWLYLHTERSEEDFEDDGTSSTKRWKRQKKDAFEGGGVGVGELPPGCYENGSPGGMEQDGGGSGGGNGSGGGGFGIELRLPETTTSAIYSAGRTELVYSKSGSLSSPRVLNGSGSLAADPAMPSYMELLPPATRPIPAPWEAHAHASWNQQGVVQAGQQEQTPQEQAAWSQHGSSPPSSAAGVAQQDPTEFVDVEAMAAANRDADAMITGD